MYYRGPGFKGAHAVLAARGQWTTNEKTLIDRAGLRSIDQFLAGLSAEPGGLLSAIDQAAAVLCLRGDGGGFRMRRTPRVLGPRR